MLSRNHPAVDVEDLARFLGDRDELARHQQQRSGSSLSRMRTSTSRCDSARSSASVHALEMQIAADRSPARADAVVPRQPRHHLLRRCRGRCGRCARRSCRLPWPDTWRCRRARSDPRRCPPWSGKSAMPRLVVRRRLCCLELERASARSQRMMRSASTRSILVRNLRHQDCEFVAAETAENLVAPHLARDLARDPDQHRVARAVAEGVVDVLEIVEIEEQQRHARPVRARHPRSCASSSSLKRWRL